MKQKESEDPLVELFARERQRLLDRDGGISTGHELLPDYVIREQLRIQERTGLLSGKVHEEKYPEDNNSLSEYCPPEINNNNQGAENTQQQQQKKKKRKKQKKNKGKKSQ